MFDEVVEDFLALYAFRWLFICIFTSVYKRNIVEKYFYLARIKIKDFYAHFHHGLEEIWIISTFMMDLVMPIDLIQLFIALIPANIILFFLH